MDAIGPDSIAPPDDLQEDLQAALAEIDRVSGESPAAVETPGDGLEEPADTSVADTAPPPPPESVDDILAEASEAIEVGTDAAEAAEPADEVLPTPVDPPDETDTVAQDAGEEPAETAIAEAKPAPQDEPEPAGSPTPTDSEEPATTAAELEQPPPEQPSTGATPNESDEAPDATTPYAETPSPDSETPPPPKSHAADDQLSALFSEIEEDVADTKHALPEVDLGFEAASGVPDEGKQDEVEAPAPDEEAPDTEAALTQPQPEDRKLRFKIGKKSTKKKAAASRPPAAPRKQKAAIPAAQPTTPWGKRLFRFADQALDRVNRPFEHMQDHTRALVGCIALTTVIVSMLAIILMPLILPNRDAITFLQEKRAVLDAPPPPQETGEDEAPFPEDE